MNNFLPILISIIGGICYSIILFYSKKFLFISKNLIFDTLALLARMLLLFLFFYFLLKNYATNHILIVTIFIVTYLITILILNKNQSEQIKIKKNNNEQ